MADLVEKHRTGTNEIDHPDRAPTGPAYQHIYQQQMAMRSHQLQLQKDREERKQEEERKLNDAARQTAERLDDDDDSDFDDDLFDDDPVLDAIREKRMAELKQQQKEHAENVAKGHGQYRTISQDEFLPECTGTSTFVVVHFFHSEFERCKIMDHHLKIIATKHTTCKILRIDAG